MVPEIYRVDPERVVILVWITKTKCVSFIPSFQPPTSISIPVSQILKVGSVEFPELAL